MREKRYICNHCGAEIRPTGRMGAPCLGCGRAGTGQKVKPDPKPANDKRDWAFDSRPGVRR